MAFRYLEYANSSDGLAWTKPNLGRYDLAIKWPTLKKLDKNNNIVMQGGGLGIYHDLHESNPALRYKISGGSPAGCYRCAAEPRVPPCPLYTPWPASAARTAAQCLYRRRAPLSELRLDGAVLGAGAAGAGAAADYGPCPFALPWCCPAPWPRGPVISADGAENCVVGTAGSPDGINNWTAVTPLVFPKPWRPDCHTNLFYDPPTSR